MQNSNELLCITISRMLPERIKEYLLGRGISEKVIGEYGIGWDGMRIIIPVRDRSGKLLFNKYRRDPHQQGIPGVPDVPKYSYDKGAASTLFGTQCLSRPEGEYGPVIVCEGELDALVLISNGLRAVSSTGGAKTFSEEMAAELAGYGVVICYDNDEAGVEGALRVLKFVPHAGIMWLPESVGTSGDVTDFVRMNGFPAFLALRDTARRYELPVTDWFGRKKDELVALKRKAEDYADYAMGFEREMRDRGESGWQVRRLIAMHLTEIDRLRAAIARPKKAAVMDADALVRAKAFPISELVEFNRQKKAKCLWHDDGDPSMHYYESQNKVHCFSCGHRGDAVDVYMALNKVSFSEAVQALCR